MSSVNGIGSDLYQLLQGFSANQQAQPPATTAASAQAGSQQAPQGAHGHHHHHGGGGQFFQQIQSAVTQALQSAKSDSSADPNQVVQDAIAKVLQNRGTDSAQTAGNSGTTSPNAPAAADGSTGQNGDASRQAFMQLLQANGIDPQQFHSDFLAAIQNAQGGQVDPSTAFKSFPTGSGVDTTV